MVNPQLTTFIAVAESGRGIVYYAYRRNEADKCLGGTGRHYAVYPDESRLRAYGCRQEFFAGYEIYSGLFGTGD